ncbi:hypothetical protein AS156_18175 [Bradyrhizobium macuxiense]|uniref:Alpha/beta hydrolase family protein DUF900 n=1 Tax=Bradyrhizobium macuxiense TaxID=1755647 RepID=A0A120FJ18_9BRAD|nr:alpha/beta hydrolase [Bradyrhizobium macuxiense]KWV48409.1 hypothetical protein AS156_18175 [Bradyrhizobium macuxiense]
MIFSTTDGKLDPGQERTFDQLETELARAGAKVLLHLHGGLVNEKAGRETAVRLAGPAPTGLGLPAEWSQIYVVWHTGVIETIRTNWLDLAHDDRLYQVVLEKLMWFVAKKLALPAAGRSAADTTGLTEQEIRKGILGNGDRRKPFDRMDKVTPQATAGGRDPVTILQGDHELSEEFKTVLKNDQHFNEAVADIDAAINSGLEGRAPAPAGQTERGEKSYRRLDEKIRTPIEEKQAEGEGGRGAVAVSAFLLKHAGKIAFRCFSRFRTKRDHGFHATLVEEVAREMYGDLLGAKIWGMIVKDAADHFSPGGFGLKLLAALSRTTPVHVVVTAHSAGSIWVAEMLNAMQKTDKNVSFDLVLLAPAVRTDVFAEAIKSAGKNISRCRMFTMSDELERVDAVLGHEWGYIYPSSLLYLVSGMFEELGAKAFTDAPLVGMQRFVGVDWLNDEKQTSAEKSIAAFFQQPSNGSFYSPTPGITTADSHSNFTREELTLASVSRFLTGQ